MRRGALTDFLIALVITYGMLRRARRQRAAVREIEDWTVL